MAIPDGTCRRREPWGLEADYELALRENRCQGHHLMQDEKLSWMAEMGFTWLVSLFPCGGVGFYSSSRQLPPSAVPAPQLVARM